MKKNKFLVALVVVLLVAMMLPMAAMANSANSPQIAGPGAFSMSGLSQSQQFTAVWVGTAQEQALNTRATAMGANTYSRGWWDLTIFDTATNMEVQPAPGVPVTVYLGGVTPSSRVQVYHVKADGSMEAIPGPIAGNNTITFIPNGFSIYGFYVGNDAAATTTTTTTTTTSMTSPQTGVYA